MGLQGADAFFKGLDPTDSFQKIFSLTVDAQKKQVIMPASAVDQTDERSGSSVG